MAKAINFPVEKIETLERAKTEISFSKADDLVAARDIFQRGSRRKRNSKPLWLALFRNTDQHVTHPRRTRGATGVTRMGRAHFIASPLCKHRVVVRGRG